MMGGFRNAEAATTDESLPLNGVLPEQISESVRTDVESVLDDASHWERITDGATD